VLDELGSAWKIINVLQKELSIYSSSNSVCEDNPVWRKASNSSAISTEWTLVPTGNHLHNQRKTKKHLIISSDQTIETTNRFTLLSNLEVVDMALHEPLEQNKSTPARTTSDINQHHHNIGFKIPTLINGRLNYKEWNPPSAAKKKSMSVSRLYPNTKENKVRVLGDSYLKEIAAKIDQFLTSNYEVSMSIYSHSIDLYKRCGNSLFVCLFAFI
jgi:hypothetical protein